MTRYYTLGQDGELEDLRFPVDINGEAKLHPSKEECAALSAYTKADDPEPEHSEGVILQPDGWLLRDGEWHQKWKVIPVLDPIPDPEPEPDPAPKARTFSKLQIVAALTKMGLWSQTKEWIINKGIYDLYLAAQVFAEGNEYFDMALNELKTLLCLDDHQIQAILQQAEIRV